MHTCRQSIILIFSNLLSCNICDHEIRMFAIVEIYCQVTVIPLNQMSILDQGSQVGYLYRNEHSPVGKPSGSSSSDEYSTRDEILYKSLCRDDQCQRSSFRCCAFYVILGSNRQYGYIAHKLLCCWVWNMDAYFSLEVLSSSDSGLGPTTSTGTRCIALLASAMYLHDSKQSDQLWGIHTQQVFSQSIHCI